MVFQDLDLTYDQLFIMLLIEKNLMLSSIELTPVNSTSDTPATNQNYSQMHVSIIIIAWPRLLEVRIFVSNKVL